MNQNFCIIIHYHEIALKGKNRNWFERQLINNIKVQLTNLPYNKIHLTAARIFCFGINESLWNKYASRLRRIIGIKYAILVSQSKNDIETINHLTARLLKDIEFSSFPLPIIKNRILEFKSFI